MIPLILDKYFEKTKGFYPFFKYCPKKYQNYYFVKRAKNILGYNYNLFVPATFNEKIRWLIFNERLKTKSLLTDKIKVKAYVTALIGEGHCAPVYGIWNDFDDIDFSYLPNRFVLKANHAWAMNMFITDKNFIKKNKKMIWQLTKNWLKIKYEQFSLEPQYSFIEPKLFTEFYRPLKAFRSDYQVHCINEVPYMTEVVLDTENTRAFQFYDIDWKLLPYSRYNKIGFKYVQDKPDFYDEMIEYAKILCKGFSYVRIDFAKSVNSLHVVEMTFTPHSCLMPFNDEAHDYELGSVLKLPFELKKETELTNV